MIKKIEYPDDDEGTQPSRVSLPSFIPEGAQRPKVEAASQTPPAPSSGTEGSKIDVSPTFTKEGNLLAKELTTQVPANGNDDPGREPAMPPTPGASNPNAGSNAAVDEVKPETLALLERLARELLEEQRSATNPPLLSEEQMADLTKRLLTSLRTQPELLAQLATIPEGVEVASGRAARLASAAAAGTSLANGIGALVGSGASALGGAVRGAGMGLRAAAEVFKGGTSKKDSDGGLAPLPLVLPRVSEYRISQVEAAVTAFEREQEKFWRAAADLDTVRKEMREISAKSGTPFQDIAANMRPGGEFAQLRTKFDEAVKVHPEARERKKAMDKAMDSFVRQYGRASEEVISADIDGSPYFEALKKRLDVSKDKMLSGAAQMPAFENEAGKLDPTYYERLQQAINKIVERIKEVTQEFMATLRGNRAESDDPSP